MSSPSPTIVDHLIIGAGFGGMCAAIKLDEDGERDWVLVDQGDSVGGTWRDNRYPGAACDVPSQLYSFSFAPNKEWSRSFSAQPEIEDYLQRVARDHDLLGRSRLGVSVTDLAWDDEQQRWLVETTAGTWAARTVISATGALSAPSLPDIEGIDSFAGETFHTARWPEDVDLTGKRVAIIGTGASAIQVIPEITEQVSHLDVYQRTPPWVIPRHDRTYSGLERAALRHVPGLQQLYRRAIYWGRECYVPAFTWQPAIAKPAELAARGNIAKGISDPALREAVTPDFAIGCKRILISNTYYPALDRDHVDLVTSGIARVTPTGVVDRDGTERPIDVLIVATGFTATDLPIARHVTGREGRTLAETWSSTGMSAYKGTTVAGFPNLFFVVGPNTGLGHSSMVFVIESQVAYIRRAIQTMRRHRYATVEVTTDAEREWSTDMQRRMKRTVWHRGGCASWYLDEHGNNTTLWPRSTVALRALLSDFDVARYRVAAERGATTDATTGADPTNPSTPTSTSTEVPA